MTRREILVRHLLADDSYVILDLLQSYVNGLILRKSSKRKAYFVIRSFFAHNHCGLPQDASFRIKGDRPPVEPKLTIQNIVEVYQAATLRYKRIILFK